LIASVGDGWCFILNAVSFIAVVASLLTMDRSQLKPSPPWRGTAVSYARVPLRGADPGIGVPLLMMGLIGMLAYEFQVTLPVFAQRVFHGGAETYGIMTAAMGVGAVVGGLMTASGAHRPPALVIAASVFGAALCAAAAAPVLTVAFFALALVGYASVSFLSMVNSTLQLGTEPQMRAG